MRLAVLLLLPALLSACTPSASNHRGRRPGDARLVAQWSLFGSAPPQHGFSAILQASAAVARCREAEGRIERAGRDLYAEGGNDIGRGRCAVFLYTDRVDETAERLNGLRRSGQLPPDLRIAVTPRP